MAMAKMDDLIELAERHGWTVRLYDDVSGPSGKKTKSASLEKFSPAGEDLVIEFDYEDDDDFVDKVKEYYQNFDPEEHVEMLIGARKAGVRGVPGVFALVEDAKKIDKMLADLVLDLDLEATYSETDGEEV